MQQTNLHYFTLQILLPFPGAIPSSREPVKKDCVGRPHHEDQIKPSRSTKAVEMITLKQKYHHAAHLLDNDTTLLENSQGRGRKERAKAKRTVPGKARRSDSLPPSL